MHRYLQSSGPLFLFRRPVVLGKECKSCPTTFMLPLLHMEQTCLQSKALSQEQHCHLTLTNPSTRNSIPIPVHHSAGETITHSPCVFCTWKSGQIQRYVHKITKVLAQDVGLSYQVQSLQSWNYLLCKQDRHKDAWLPLDHAQSLLLLNYKRHKDQTTHWRNHHCHYQQW